MERRGVVAEAAVGILEKAETTVYTIFMGS